uniref:Uncharacterized protein n=1 Tax=Myoviridae sp. ctPkm1 TaxID=2825099 RepID=A0A8S5TYF4_9CAUD|nr:MAG TPA: hypothetical protein [Myoviridae sp. ctPkm1]
MDSKKDARQGCNRGRANAISNEELNTFGGGLALMFAGFFALALADMGAWWAMAVAAACAVGVIALLAGKE